MPKNVIMRTLAVGLALLLPLATGAWAQEEPAATDEIELKNGSRVIGKVTGIRDGVVTVETDFAGALSVSLLDGYPDYYLDRPGAKPEGFASGRSASRFCGEAALASLARH